MKRMIIAALLAVAAFLCAACGLFRPSPEKQLGLLLEDAERLELAGNYEEAVLKYEAAIVIEPKNAALYAAAAAAYTEIGDRENAEKHYKSAIQCEPGAAEHYLALSALYAADGDTDGAAKVLQTAHSAIPEDEGIIKEINALAETAYTRILNERLLPQRGLSSFFTVDEGGWFPWRADGLIGACLFDLDLDGIDEMLVFEHTLANDKTAPAAGYRTGEYAKYLEEGTVMRVYAYEGGMVTQKSYVILPSDYSIHTEFFLIKGQGKCCLAFYREDSEFYDEMEVFAYTERGLESVVGYTSYAGGVEAWTTGAELFPADAALLREFQPGDGDSAPYLLFTMRQSEYDWDEIMSYEEFEASQKYPGVQSALDALLSPIGMKAHRNAHYGSSGEVRFSAMGGYQKLELLREVRPSDESWDFITDGHRDVLGDAVRWLPLGSASTDPQDMRGRALAAYAALLRSGPQLYEGEGYSYSLLLDAFALVDINGDGIEELIAGEVDDHPYDGIISQEPNVDNVNIYTYTDTGIRLLDSVFICALEHEGTDKLDLVDGRYLLTYDYGTSGYQGYYFGEWDGAGELVWTRYSTYLSGDYDNEVTVYALNEEPISEQEFNSMPMGDVVPVRFYYNNETTRAELLGE